LGDDFPPAPTILTAKDNSPIRQIQVIYPKPKTEPLFWRPFAALAGHDHIPFAGKLAVLDTGWLWLYILAYLPALFLFRVLLRVA
jgi:hypothetical protein